MNVIRSKFAAGVFASELCRRNFNRLAGIVALVVLGSAAHGRITELLIDRRSPMSPFTIRTPLGQTEFWFAARKWVLVPRLSTG
jgi:hypothetical protein